MLGTDWHFESCGLLIFSKCVVAILSYTRVVLISLWSSISWMYSVLVPCSMWCVAKLWRNEWGVIFFLIFAFFFACLMMASTVDGVTCPLLVAKRYSLLHNLDWRYCFISLITFCDKIVCLSLFPLYTLSVPVQCGSGFPLLFLSPIF